MPTSPPPTDDDASGPATGSIRAVVFDFDGTLVDTEFPEFEAWREIYRAHGRDLPRSVWAQCIGTADSGFDPLTHLRHTLGRPLDEEAVRAAHSRRVRILMDGRGLLPGVAERLDEADALALPLGIASSSTRAWINSWLEKLGLSGRFQALAARDDVARTKPDPALFTLIAERLGVDPAEILAIEDSPNGAAAALRAGMHCVVVPHALTEDLWFPPSVRRIPSLTALSLRSYLAR